MGLFNNLKELSKRITANTPVGNQEVGLSNLSYNGQSPEDRQAVFPAWFFSSRLGQPRRVDTQKIRSLAQSPWAQMVLSTFKKQIYSTEWDVLPEDPDDEIDHEEDIRKVKEKLNNINDNGDTINDINSELVTDIGEIDAGVTNMVYTANSYLFGDVPVYDAWGRVESTELGLVLKPLGQRELLHVKSVDGSSMLKQVDIHKNLLNYWQYSFKHPRQNPTRFDKEEVVYYMMNNKSYSVYGFSAIEAVQQVLELLIQGTRYNKDLYTNNAVPDILVSLPKLPKEQLKKLKRNWNNQYKGKPHQVGFINWAIENFHKLTDSNRDLEWLNGQQWYFKLVFGAFGVSPEEAGFTESSNKATGDSQERVTVRNALKPYFLKLEQPVTKRYITEILQKEDHGLKFVYKPKDHTLEKIEFEQDMLELDHYTMSINEFRRKKGREPVEGGDDVFNNPAKQMNPFGGFGGSDNRPNTDDKNKPDESKPDDEKPKDGKKSLNKDLEIDAGEDMIEEATDYSDFLLKTFNRFEKQVLSAIDKIHIEKSYTEKNFGSFLKDMFNSVNTVLFARHVKRLLKQDLIAGLTSAEDELDMDIGYSRAFEDKLNVLQAQQINGYTINGKKWFGIKGVTKEIQADVIKIVQDGIREKDGIDKIKTNITNKFDKFSDWRSEMIARTETNRIINEGKILGYKESGLEGGKIVSVALDDRTSEICERMHKYYSNNPIGLDDDFIDPLTNKAYRAPPFHPSCRTTIAFRPD